MSVPYLVNDPEGHPSASRRIPVMARPFVSDRGKKTLDLVERFVEDECIPADAVFAAQVKAAGHAHPSNNVAGRFESHPQIIEDLKKRAKELGLCNVFLPKNHSKGGAGYSNLEYALMAELLGKSDVASEVRAVTDRPLSSAKPATVPAVGSQLLKTTVLCDKLLGDLVLKQELHGV